MVAAYDVVVVRRLADQVRDEALALIRQHAEGLSEAEIAHDVEGEPREALAHVNTLGAVPADAVEKLVDGVHDGTLHALERSLAESDREHAPLEAVLEFRDGVVRVVHTLDGRIGGVELALLDVPRHVRVAVDALQRGRRIETEHVGCDAHHGSVLLVRKVEFQITIALPRMPGGVPIRPSQLSSAANAQETPKLNRREEGVATSR